MAITVELTRESVADGGVGGMGHDADDYFTHTWTAIVRDATGAVLKVQSWSVSYNAGDQSSVGKAPREAIVDGDRVIARFANGREETIYP